MVDRKLLLDAIRTQCKGRGHDATIVDQDMQWQAQLHKLLGCPMAAGHAVQVQFQKVELDVLGGVGQLGNVDLGALDRLEGTLTAATGQEDAGAVGSQGHGGGIAQSGVGASDDGDFAAQVGDVLVGVAVSLEHGLPEGWICDYVGERHVCRCCCVAVLLDLLRGRVWMVAWSGDKKQE